MVGNIFSLNSGECQSLPPERLLGPWVLVYWVGSRAAFSPGHLAKLGGTWQTELGTNHWQCLGLFIKKKKKKSVKRRYLSTCSKFKSLWPALWKRFSYDSQAVPFHTGLQKFTRSRSKPWSRLAQPWNLPGVDVMLKHDDSLFVDAFAKWQPVLFGDNWKLT